MAGLIECVPNFSEGRDLAKIESIRAAIAAVPEILVLKAELDSDHNRSVITFAGPAEAVLQAAFSAVRRAAELIDLSTHTGVHPRIGAADVVPFVPLEGSTLADCIGLAHRLGQRVWDELQIPVYFYEAAALHPDRTRLENVRRGGFENPAMAPDLGGPALHASAGACIIGARQFLIAFNINLTTPDVSIARAIARKIRTSSGGMPSLKAMGVRLSSRDLAQVSMNLTNFEQTGLHDVFERVKQEAEMLGTGIAGSEIIGLVPAKALEAAAAYFLKLERFSDTFILENRLRNEAGKGSK